MNTSTLQVERTRSPIRIPAIGLDLEVCIEASATEGKATLIHTTDAPGYGPPMHRHERETEVFHVLKGRYLFEVDGERIVATAGTTLTAPVGSTHRFVNIDDAPSRMLVLISPGFDATAFFGELRSVMSQGIPDAATMARFGGQWSIEFLGPPLGVAAGHAESPC